VIRVKSVKVPETRALKQAKTTVLSYARQFAVSCALVETYTKSKDKESRALAVEHRERHRYELCEAAKRYEAIYFATRKRELKRASEERHLEMLRTHAP